MGPLLGGSPQHDKILFSFVSLQLRRITKPLNLWFRVSFKTYLFAPDNVKYLVVVVL